MHRVGAAQVVSSATLLRPALLPGVQRHGSGKVLPAAAAAVLMCLLVQAPLSGQQAAKLSETLADRFDRKLLNGDPEIHWMPDGFRFFFRHELDAERHEFLLVDPENGHRSRAFDHAGLAEQLRLHGVSEAAEDRLPLRGLRFDADSQGWRFSVGELRGHWSDAAGQFSVEADSASAAGLVPLEVVPQASRQNGSETSVRFVNQTAEELRLFWLDRDGGRRFYALLPPGADRQQHTYAGHVWLLADEHEEIVAAFRAVARPEVAVVHADLPPPRARTAARNERSSRRSPDRRWEVRFQEHNVVLCSAEGEQQVLTRDGTAESGYGEEVFWAPDSSHFVVYHTRRFPQRIMTLVESSPPDQLQPKVHSVPYAKPGDPIDIRQPRLFRVASAAPVPLNEALFDTPWSISRVEWSADAGRFLFLYNQRGHQAMRVISVDAETGEATAVIDEQCATFFDYNRKLYYQYLPETEEIIWMSERDGWNHLYLVDARNGRFKRQLTSGQWVVRRVEHVDVPRREIWFYAGGIHEGQDPYHEHMARVSLDDGRLVVLTEGDGTHQVERSPDGRFLLDRWSRVDLPPRVEVRDAADGALVCDVVAADATALRAAGWVPPERFAAAGRDERTPIYGIIFRPTQFNAERAYPVVESIYAGPQGAHVPKRFQVLHEAQQVAELGFIVVQVDGMGTNFRSKAFHDVCWQNLADAGFPDRMAWIRAAAATRPWMDLSRVGIYGVSAGGQSAVRALVAHHDFYHVAVAACGCHDNRLDKLWWNELWMGWPVGPHYEAQSNVTQAERLRGKLLLIVGELDQNVDPASTLQLADALIRSDKEFELLMVPGAGHGVGGAYGRRRMMEFLVQHLQNSEPQ